MEKDTKAELPPLPEVTTGTQTVGMTNPFDKQAAQPVQEATPITPETPQVEPVPVAGSPVPVITHEEITVTKTKLPFGLKTFPIVGVMVAAVVILSVAILGMLLLTEQGKRLIGLSSASSSSSLTSSSESSTSTSESADFNNSNAEETVDQVTNEIDSQLQDVDSEEDFENFDAQVEFGL